MKTTDNNLISIEFNDKEYLVEKDKLTYVLNLICPNDIKGSNLEYGEIYCLLEKYGLLDEYFLENINKI